MAEGKEHEYYYDRGLEEIEYLCRAKKNSLEEKEAFRWIFLRTRNCQKRDSRVNLNLLERALYRLIGFGLPIFDKSPEARKELDALKIYIRLGENKRLRDDMCKRYRKEIMPYILQR